MSRNIDYSKKLSDADREWLLWNNGQAAVMANDEEFAGKISVTDDRSYTSPVLTGQEPSATADRTQAVGMNVANIEADLDRERRQAQFDAALSGSKPDSDPSTSDWSVESDEAPYEDWHNDDLKAELAKRELSRSGVKVELVERLRASDEESESEEDGE